MRLGIILVDAQRGTKLLLRERPFTLCGQEMTESIVGFLILRIDLDRFLERHIGFLLIRIERRYAFLVIALRLLHRLLGRRTSLHEPAKQHHRDETTRPRPTDLPDKREARHAMCSKWVNCLNARNRS